MRVPLSRPRRLLITLDAVGGVWRYTLDLARGLQAHDVSCLLVGLGPEPGAPQRAECGTIPNTELVWTDEPLDWMVTRPACLVPGTKRVAALARNWGADLIHLNLPSQAAGLAADVPVAVVAHSCVPTWWDCVHGTELPTEWTWQRERNRQGLRHADLIVTPSESHSAALRRAYGSLPGLHVVHNATTVVPADDPKEAFVLAVGRWWDAGKNGAVLDAVAESIPWPVVLAGPLTGPNGENTVFRHVETPGALRHDDVLGLMRRAPVFAAPSRYEPFGLAVAEAAISGAALVLADIPTFRELWHEAAIFVAANDADAWSNAVSNLMTDEPLRRRLAASAGSRARHFTLSRQAARLYELYTRTSVAAAT